MRSSAQSGQATAKTLPAGDVPLQVFDPRRGDVAFKLERLEDLRAAYSQPRRCNYFTILWLPAGGGIAHVDLRQFAFSGPALLFFNPYQTFFLEADSRAQGVSLQFHANFFCIETHHEAVGCNGVLFNDLYGQPLVQAGAAAAEFDHLLTQMEREVRGSGVAQAEALVSFLKLFLIRATRLKLEQQGAAPCAAASGRPAVLERLAELIERDFRTQHSPAHYASALHITPKALGRLVKAHLSRTLTELIRERLLRQAKWQLLHTQRPVKEIAWEAGFADEYYFSRLFRRATGLSPTAFRAFETAIRSQGKLSS